MRAMISKAVHEAGAAATEQSAGVHYIHPAIAEGGHIAAIRSGLVSASNSDLAWATFIPQGIRMRTSGSASSSLLHLQPGRRRARADQSILAARNFDHFGYPVSGGYDRVEPLDAGDRRGSPPLWLRFGVHQVDPRSQVEYSVMGGGVSSGVRSDAKNVIQNVVNPVRVQGQHVGWGVEALDCLLNVLEGHGAHLAQLLGYD